jgi:ParB-like chromosome segregation protein Spo0J
MAHKSERFVVRSTTRDKIHGADYNPRMITDKARRQLRNGIAKLGMLQPIVVNERTGNVVSGHQCLAIMDMESKGDKEYELTVAVVDLDDKQEREANLLLNNYEAQGDFDLEKLSEVLRSGVDAEAGGFDAADIRRLFGDDTEVAHAVSNEVMEEFVDRHNALVTQVKSIQKATMSSGEFYAVVVFRDHEERDAWLSEMGLPEDRYQSGVAVRSAMKCARGTASSLSEVEESDSVSEAVSVMASSPLEEDMR